MPSALQTAVEGFTTGLVADLILVLTGVITVIGGFFALKFGVPIAIDFFKGLAKK